MILRTPLYLFHLFKKVVLVVKSKNIAFHPEFCILFMLINGTQRVKYVC